jgi:hypothetical protein
MGKLRYWHWMGVQLYPLRKEPSEPFVQEVE